MWCWGFNADGEFGDGTTISTMAPMSGPVSGAQRDLGGGYQFLCSVLMDGTLSCSGYNWYGQLGRGTMTGGTPQPNPMPVLEPAAPESARYWKLVGSSAVLTEVMRRWDCQMNALSGAPLSSTLGGEHFLKDGSLLKQLGANHTYTWMTSTASELVIDLGQARAVEAVGIAKAGFNTASGLE
jgi:hypothetical protein